MSITQETELFARAISQSSLSRKRSRPLRAACPWNRSKASCNVSHLPWLLPPVDLTLWLCYFLSAKLSLGKRIPFLSPRVPNWHIGSRPGHSRQKTEGRRLRGAPPAKARICCQGPFAPPGRFGTVPWSPFISRAAPSPPSGPVHRSGRGYAQKAGWRQRSDSPPCAG